MKILCIANYYYPYISGVSEYLRNLCVELVKSGQTVTVLCSNHDKLDKYEIIDGVKVIRAPIICKISKGTVSPAFIHLAVKLSKENDIVNLHLPMLESGVISSLINNKKLVTTYQCDINMPNTLINRLIVKVMDTSNNICLKKSQKIIVLSEDYAMQSRIASRYKSKIQEVSPPIKDYVYIEQKKTGNKKNIGFCGRIVEEKGIDILLQAFKILREKRNDISLQIVGDYTTVAGGSVYDELIRYIKKNGIEDVVFYGKIPENQMEKFYSSLDVFVLPSVNSMEAFGMVQVEAMYCGTPVVSTNLNGVRMIVHNTGMGKTVKRKDAKMLAEAIDEVINNRNSFVKSKEYVQNIYSTKRCVEDYIKIYERVYKQK